MNRNQLKQHIHAARGVGADEAPFFEDMPADPLVLFRDPDEIPDMRAGTEILAGIIRGAGRVGIFGDYDADGITATAIMARWLGEQGIDVECILASRSSGYGFNTQAARELSRCDLVVVFDCGTSDEGSCQLVRAAGTPLIVVDHHTVPKDPGSHPASALINPKRGDSSWPFDGLCSAALSWVLCWRTARALGRDVPTNLLWLAAIGSVADRAPLRWESRLLVRIGLEQMNLQTPPIVRALLRAAGRDTTPITETHLGWTIGPRLNAPGRMGDPRPALDALLATSPFSLQLAVDALERVNGRRQEAQRDAEQMIQDTGPIVLDHAVIAHGMWTTGVSGIIASRIGEEYARSAFAITVGSDPSRPASGSARGWGGQSVYAALAHVAAVSPGTLRRWGGHRAAAGFSIRAGCIDDFVSAIKTWQPEAIQESSQSDMTWEPRLVRSRGLLLTSYIEQLAPYGQGFERPVITIPGATIRSRRAFGQERNHLKLFLVSGPQIILWRAARANPDLQRKVRIDVTGEVGIAEWAGDRFVQISDATISRLPTP